MSPTLPLPRFLLVPLFHRSPAARKPPVPVGDQESRRSQSATRKSPLPIGGQESRRSQSAARKPPVPVGDKKVAAPNRRQESRRSGRLESRRSRRSIEDRSNPLDSGTSSHDLGRSSAYHLPPQTAGNERSRHGRRGPRQHAESRSGPPRLQRPEAAGRPLSGSGEGGDPVRPERRPQPDGPVRSQARADEVVRKAAPGRVEIHQPNNANVLLASPFTFSRHGQSGMELGETIPHLATVADDICLIRSMHTEHNNHSEGLHMLLTCHIFAGRRCWGRGCRTRWGRRIRISRLRGVA